MAGRIPENIIQEIKNRLSIREVVSDYVTLARDGANHKALCPFHKEKTPSFKVHEGMGIFRCFGCGESGNIFTFLMKMEGITFSEAVQRLAARAGVEIPKREQTQEQKDRDKKGNLIFRANELAQDFFIRMLKEDERGKAAREYLNSRDISEEWAEKFRLGYAPDSWEELLQHLKSQGISESIILEAGLVIARDSGGYYDRFRKRLMFPIRDIGGRVRGFGGRALDDADTSSPKYINSPETPVYKKGQSFYGLDLAKDGIRQADRVVIVEGYFDRIRLAMAGIEYALASLGTAFTADQARLVRRYTRNVFTVFDTDAAGLKASLRALEIFLEEGVTPRIVLLPSGKDPDDFVVQAGGTEGSGGESFQKLMDVAPSLVDFFMEQELEKGGGTPAQIAQAVQRMAPVLSKIRDPIERSLYVKKLSEKLGIPQTDIQRRLFRPVNKRDDEPIQKKADDEESKFTGEEEEILSLLLHHPQVAAKIKGEGVIESLYNSELSGFMRKILDQIEKHGRAEPGLILHETEDEKLASLVARLAMGKTERHQPDQVERALNDCIHRLKMLSLTNEKARVQRELYEAERNRQEERVNQLRQEMTRLMKKQSELRAEGMIAG